MELARDIAEQMHSLIAECDNKPIDDEMIDRIAGEVISLTVGDEKSKLMDLDIDLNNIFDLAVHASDNIGVTEQYRISNFKRLLASIRDYYDFYVAPTGLLPNTPASIIRLLQKFQTPSWRDYDNYLQIRQYIQQDADLYVIDLMRNGKKYYLVNTDDVKNNHEIEGLIKLKNCDTATVIPPFEMWRSKNNDGKSLNVVSAVGLMSRSLNQYALFARL